MQVKASGSPGPVVHHVVPSNDERIIIGIEKAVRQLPRDRDQVGLIALTALTGAYLSIDCGPVVVHCVGATSSRWGRLSLLPSNVGKFFRPGWEHVSAVLMLDYMRGLDARGDHAFRYACTVLVNPKARVPVSPDWFPHARVLVLDSGTFRWIRGAPSDRISLPDGTPLDATE